MALGVRGEEVSYRAGRQTIKHGRGASHHGVSGTAFVTAIT